jgi:hypothetical protein
MKEYPEKFQYNEFGRMVAVFDPVIEFPKQAASKLLRGDLGELVEDLESLRVYIKNSVGYKWDNDHFRICDAYGEPFKFGLYELGTENDKRYSLTIWGLNDIIVWKSDYFVAEQINDMFQRMEKFTNGSVHCSKCGNEIIWREAMGRRYFAGIYCVDCWENEMKQVEARETYD